jgi:hypothetical protein
MESHEALMKLTELDKFCNGKEQIKCPVCNESLRILMCPPKIVRIN